MSPRTSASSRTSGMADAVITLSKADDIMVETSEGDMLRKLQRVIDPSMPDKLEFADFMRVMLALVGDECTRDQLRREWDEQVASNTGLMTIDRLCTLILSPDHYHVPDRLQRYLDNRTKDMADEPALRQQAPEPHRAEAVPGQWCDRSAAIAAREERHLAGNEVAGRARRLLRAAARSGALRGALVALGGEDCSERSHPPEIVPLKRRGGYLHVKARSSHPSLPERAHVGDEHVPWSVEWASYKPPSYSADILRTASWADPADPSRMQAELQGRLSHEGRVKLEPGTGFPINPVGRTGLRDRGILGKWGPNHAADPIVTRLDPSTRRLQVVVIQRSDTGEWALPGGMVDPGETVSQAVKREFTEEAGNFEHDEQKAREFEHLTGELFASGELVYSGYVDDPRNTDSAWMETAAFHFHCEPQLAEMLQLNAGDDAVKVKWLDVSMEEPDYRGLYASHRDWVDFVARRHKDADTARTPDHAARQQAMVAIELAASDGTLATAISAALAEHPPSPRLAASSQVAVQARESLQPALSGERPLEASPHAAKDVAPRQQDADTARTPDHAARQQAMVAIELAASDGTLATAISAALAEHPPSPRLAASSQLAVQVDAERRRLAATLRASVQSGALQPALAALS